MPHFQFTSQPFAERVAADVLWPDDRMQQGLVCCGTSRSMPRWDW